MTTDEPTPAFVESLLRNSTTEADFMAAARMYAYLNPWPIVLELYRHQRSARILSRFNKQNRDRWFNRATEHAKRIEQLETALVDWRKVADTDFAALFVETGKLLDIADRIIADRAATEQLIQQASEETHEAANLTGKST